jgi:hypothetical protein
VLEATNYINGFTNGNAGYGDRFAIFDSTNDYMYSTLTNLKPSGSSSTPRVIDAENQIANVFSLSVFFPLNNGSTASGIPWTQHHGSLGDDVGTWGTTGSNVNWMLNRLKSQNLF